VRLFVFPTAGCSENEGTYNHGPVARSLCGGLPSSCFGPAYMTRGACPPCHRAGSRCTPRETLPVMLWAQGGKSPFKKGSISRVVVMPCSSCILRALPPSRPPDGVRRCLLERSASGPSPPAISPPESLRSWWCRWSCFLLTAVRGAQPRGGWCSSAIAQL
jgi:hypothetical protein